jgi:hypothetical protein
VFFTKGKAQDRRRGKPAPHGGLCVTPGGFILEVRKGDRILLARVNEILRVEFSHLKSKG